MMSMLIRILSINADYNNSKYSNLLKWNINFTLLDSLDQVVWLLSVDGATNRLASTQDLQDGACQVL